MTWEETIISIRKQPEFADLVEKAYFDEDLVLNVERFRSSAEYVETKKIIREFTGSNTGLKILDIGSGNGISAVSFSLDGNEVTAVEPDPSDTVGSGAIRKLISHFKLSKFSVVDTYAEKLPFPDSVFDVVYVRQAMHHANDLRLFVREAARVLKKGGLLLTVRDHVVFDRKDKQLFLESHPLQKYYGGENAYSVQEYTGAIQASGLKVQRILGHFDSIINYFPMLEMDVKSLKTNRNTLIENSLKSKLPSFLANIPFVKKGYAQYVEYKLGPVLNERLIPGRMYSFIAVKPA